MSLPVPARRAARWFWAFHLGLCVVFVLHHAAASVHGPLSSALAAYGAYTGAGTRYGFFAPNVPSARRLRSRALCGEEWIPVEAPLEGNEPGNRLTTIASLMMFHEVEEAVAGSWAAYAMGRLPCARAVLVEVDYYEVPAMEQYRQGARPGWKLLHVFSFARTGAAIHDEGRHP